MNFALKYKGTITNTKGICVMSMSKNCKMQEDF